MFKLLMFLGAVIWALWQGKNLILLFAILLLGACHPTSQHEVVYVVEVEEEKPAEDTLIYIENADDYSDSRDLVVYHWSNECSDFAYIYSPYDHDPSHCYYYADHHIECHWYFGYGDYEVWEWDDYSCHWRYLFDYSV